MEITDDEMDQALARLAPRVSPLTPEIETELASLTVATMRAVRPITRRRASRLAWITSLSTAAVLGVGATAVAAGLGGWAPWAESPDGTFTYTLPSGITCEERVGNLHAANPEVRRAVQDIFKTTDVVGIADVDGWNEQLLSQDGIDEYAQSVVDSGARGLTSVTDVVYAMAVSRAVMDAVDAELAERGFDMSDESNLISIQGQSVCGEEIQ